MLRQVVAYPKDNVGKPLPMEPDPEAEEDEDDEASTLLQSHGENDDREIGISRVFNPAIRRDPT